MNNRNYSFKILIVDNEIEYRETIESILRNNGYITDAVSSGYEALEKLRGEEFDLVLTDFFMSKINDIDLLEKIKREYKKTEVVVFTGYGSVKNAVESMKKGAFSYFVKSNDPEELLTTIKKLVDLKEIKQKDLDLITGDTNGEFMLETANERFKNVLDIGRKAADSNVNILILGESGVGKEVFARYIHQNSNRNKYPFVAVNCHAFSETLLESELFGHEKGAFTGAYERRIGRFEAADEGTLFLDEIGDTSPEIQVKLLRTLENKKIERIGSNKIININFRLICATNRNIYEMVAKNCFREDLFYRISTITVEIPPLRDRREDLPKLIDFFFKKAELELKKDIKKIESDVMKFLLNYHYPGNVRELKNIIERLVVLSDQGIVRANYIQDSNGLINSRTSLEKVKPLKEFRKEVETDYIKKILILCNYNKNETAKKLGISRRQLFNKLNEYGLR